MKFAMDKHLSLFCHNISDEGYKAFILTIAHDKEIEEPFESSQIGKQLNCMHSLSGKRVLVNQFNK